jgi:TonB family protein
MPYWRNFVAAAALALAIMPAPIFARHHPYRGAAQPHDPFAVLIEDPAAGPPENSTTISAERTGTIPVAGARSLRVSVETGNVQVFTDESIQVSYRAIAEADSRDPSSEEFLRQFNISVRKTSSGLEISGKVPWQGLHGPFNITIEIHIPRQFSLEVRTGAGNIDVQDIDGRVRLMSAGGNINVRRVGNSEKIPARDSAGNTNGDRMPFVSQGKKPVLPVAARLETQGGEISVGQVVGSLHATTAGGHITTGDIEGDAVLRTGGGQIYARRIAGNAELDTGGGNIRIDDAGSGISADTAGGAIVLRQTDTPIQVSAINGSISAWLSDHRADHNGQGSETAKASRPSQLTSTSGDIAVYFPRKLSATINATIEQGRGHQIAADPSLPLKISYRESADDLRTIHYAGQLNGGGEIIDLKTSSGNIVLRPEERDTQSSAASHANWRPGESTGTVIESLNASTGDDLIDVDGFFAEVRRRILESWWGAIPVDADEMQKHLERSEAPVYPEVARHAGVEGDVILRVYVSSTGRVGEVKILGGPPILARAAVEAVQHWKYQTPRMNGNPVNVVTTLVVSFRLH